MLLEEGDALSESGGMTRRGAKLRGRRAFGCEQAMLHGNQNVSDVAQLGSARQRVPATFDSADDGILDRDHTGVGSSILDCANGARKCRHRNQLHSMAPDLRDRILGVSTARALKCDAHHQVTRMRGGSRARACGSFADRLWFQHDAPRSRLEDAARRARKSEGPRAAEALLSAATASLLRARHRPPTDKSVEDVIIVRAK